jgi:hypothetical protein
VKHLSPPASEALDDLPLPSAEQHAGALNALVRLRDEATAKVEQHRLPILVEANLWLQNSELAGMPVVRMRGDSMGDTLRDGDFALVEVGHTDVADGGVFAIAQNGSVIITQVEPVYQSGRSTGRIRCTPRNPVYSQFELTLGEDARIIGRVAQRITRYL